MADLSPAARRPQSQSLAEEALDALEVEEDLWPVKSPEKGERFSLIRRALERLKDLEGQGDDRQAPRYPTAWRQGDQTVTSKEAKQLIGRAIKYAHTRRLYVHWYYAIVLDVKSKSMEIDHDGMRDWIWLSDVEIVPIAPELSPTSGGDYGHD